MKAIFLVIFFIFVFQLHSYKIKKYEFKNWPVLKGPYLGQKTPGIKPEKFAPGIISRDDLYEIGSIFSPDGKEFYYAISATTKEEKARGIYHYDLLCTKMVDGVWTKPARLPLAGKYSVADIALSLDGNRLYFCSEMPAAWGKTDSFDIWYVERRGEGWSKPVHTGMNVNTPGSETQPSFTTNGRMYYPSEGDIYYSQFLDGKYQKPVKLPVTVNTKYGEGNSFVAPDESYIIFGRWGMPKSIDGGKGSYISFRRADGSWTKAVHTQPKTGIYGTLAALSPDGKYLFYSRREGIHWVDVRVLQKLRSEN